MSVRNQLTHYELEEFFRSLQDLLVLSLNASLSFDSAEFLSRRFRKNSKRFVVKTTHFVFVWSTTTFWPRHSLIYCQQRQHCEDLSYFALHAEEEQQLSTARVGVVRSGVPGRLRLDISEDLLEVLRNGAGFRWAAIARNLHVSERTLRRRRNEFGVTSLTESFTDIDNTSLDEIVREILHVNPRIGFRLQSRRNNILLCLRDTVTIWAKWIGKIFITEN